MKYQQAIEYMNQVGKIGSRPDLETIQELLHRLGSPEKDLRVVHVAGTNGKGSSCTFIANILAQSGYQVGRYVSPVVEEFRECIQFVKKGPQTTYITEEQVAKHLSIIRRISEEMVAEGLFHPTYYEIETAMAFLACKEQKCDVVVLETLMGGELDATNVIEHPLATVFTSISLDHMQFLGDTIPKIAMVKAGIMRAGSPVVMDEYPSEVRKVIIKKANEHEATIYELDGRIIRLIKSSIEGTTFYYNEQGPYEIGMMGNHQVHNAVLAILTCKALQKQGYIIPEKAVIEGLRITRLFGRFSLVNANPDLYVDGAHNPDAVKRLIETLTERMGKRQGIFIMGVFSDKDYEEMLRIIGDLPKVVLTITAPGPRGLKSAALAEAAQKYCNHVVDCETLLRALTVAKDYVFEDDYILCFGSLSYLGQVPTMMQKIGSPA